MEIFKLVGSIFVDNEQANKSIQKTDKKASSVAQTFSKGVKTAAKWGAGIAGAAVAATAAVSKLVSSTLSEYDAIAKGATKVGISTDEYQKWSHALKQSGTDISVLQTGMKTLTNAIDGVNKGNGAAIMKFHKLGVSVHDANGQLKSQDVIMNETLYALADMENGTEKTKLAMDLFGKAGVDLLPMLENGSLAIEDLKNEAVELGLVVGGDDIDAAVKLGDTIANIKDAIHQMINTVGAAAIPVLQQFADMIVSALPEISAVFNRLTPIVAKLFETMLPPIMDLASKLFPVVLSLLETLVPIITELAADILPILTDIIGALLPPLLEVAQMILPIIRDVLQAILAFIKPIIDNVTEFIVGKINLFKEFLGGLIDFITGVFTGDWEKAWGGIIKMFKAIINQIPQTLESTFNAAISAINGLINGINKVSGKVGIPAIPNIPKVSLPRLEKGGILEKGQMGLLEGNGAEAVVPLEKNKAWTSAVAEDMNKAGIGNEEVITLLAEISEKISNLELTAGFKIIPDDRNLFNVIREQSVLNAKRGGQPITV